MNAMANTEAFNFIDHAIRGLANQLISTFKEGTFNHSKGLSDSKWVIDQQILAHTLIAQRAHQEATACKRRRNALSPVHSLPEELLLMVFQDVVDELRTTLDYYGQLLNIRSVCKAWSSIIDDQGRFWVPIFPEQALAFQDFTVAKSGGLPLEIHCSQLEPRMLYQDSSASSRCTDLLHRLIKHQWPIGLFRWHARTQSGLLRLLLTTPSLHIHTLDLAENSFRVSQMFGGIAPRLRSVTLRYVELEHRAQPFAQLRRLELRGTMEMTISNLAYTLEGTPELEHLAIGMSRLVADMQPYPNLFSTLPRLRTITLEMIGMGAATQILGWLPIHQTRLTMENIAPDASLTDLLDLVATALPSADDIDLTLHTSTSYSQSKFTMTLRANAWSLVTFCNEPVTGDECKNVFTDKFPIPNIVSSAIRSFKFIHAPHEIVQNMLSPIDAMFPSLVELGFDNSSSSAATFPEEAFEYEGRPGEPIPFAKVHIIDVTHRFAYSAVETATRLVRGRQAACRHSSDPSAPHPIPIDVVRLRFKEIPQLSPEIYTDIEALCELVATVDVVEDKGMEQIWAE